MEARQLCSLLLLFFCCCFCPWHLRSLWVLVLRKSSPTTPLFDLLLILLCECRGKQTIRWFHFQNVHYVALLLRCGVGYHAWYYDPSCVLFTTWNIVVFLQESDEEGRESIPVVSFDFSRFQSNTAVKIPLRNWQRLIYCVPDSLQILLLSENFQNLLDSRNSRNSMTKFCRLAWHFNEDKGDFQR